MLLKWQKQTTESIIIDDTAVIFESQGLIFGWGNWGLIWKQPVALLTARNQQRKRFLLLNNFALILLGFCRITIAFLALFFVNPKPKRDKMSKFTETMGPEMAKNHEQSRETLEKFFNAIQPEAVFSKPVQITDQTIVTATEVKVALSFGTGFGGGDGSDGSGGGGGSGLWGYASARPVSTISIGKDGVSVKPIIDITKIALAACVTVSGSLIFLYKVFNVKKS